MGNFWKSELEELFKKVKANILHIRHKDHNDDEIVTGVGRDNNNYNITNYEESPSSKKLIDFLQERKYKLLSQHNAILILEYEKYTDR